MAKLDLLQTVKVQKKVRNYLHQSEKQLRFTTATEQKAVTVAQRNIQNRVDTIMASERSITAFQSTLDALDPDFAPFLQIICRKTGQVIGANSTETISRTVQFHGKDRAIQLLQLQYTNYVAPFWYDTSPKSLTTLAKRDPCGYFVYAAAKCMKLDGPYANNLEAERVMQYANNLERLSLTTLVNAVKRNTDLRDQFADADKQTATSPIAQRHAVQPIETTDAENFINVRVRCQMHANLKRTLASGDMQLASIVEANEIMRRLLATSHPRNLPTNEKFWGTPMYATTGNLQMAMWIAAIQEEQSNSIRRYMKTRLAKNIELARQGVPTMSQVRAHMQNIRVKRGGLQSFFEQSSLSTAINREATLLNLEELDIFNGDTNEFSQKLRARSHSQTAQRAKQQQRNAGFAGKLQMPTPLLDSVDGTDSIETPTNATASDTANVPFKLNFATPATPATPTKTGE